MNENIKENVERIRDRVALSARRVKRDPDSISCGCKECRRITRFDKINLRGLMTIGPLVGDPKQSFKLLYRLFCNARELGFNMRYLSMGMTDDFEIAIEEGSNMIRVGRAIFQK